jgi:hypothetical protein
MFCSDCNSRKWLAFHRLKELDIPCWCSYSQPLVIAVHTPQQAIQVWSVLRQLEWSRAQAIAWLEKCYGQS